MFQIIPFTMLSEPEIVSLLSFSALILIYMMTFLKPEKEDQEEIPLVENKKEKKLQINPYLPFTSPTSSSPFYYTYTISTPSRLHLDA